MPLLSNFPGTDVLLRLKNSNRDYLIAKYKRCIKTGNVLYLRLVAKEVNYVKTNVFLTYD